MVPSATTNYLDINTKVIPCILLCLLQPCCNCDSSEHLALASEEKGFP